MVSKTNSAEYLTEYYELRIVEIIALRKAFEQSQLSSFDFQTNKGTTKVEINEVSEKETQIRIMTLLENRTFQAAFYYNLEQEAILKRVEL